MLLARICGTPALPRCDSQAGIRSGTREALRNSREHCLISATQVAFAEQSPTGKLEPLPCRNCSRTSSQPDRACRFLGSGP
eukprot:3852381-Rhodomonas_salina.2